MIKNLGCKYVIIGHSESRNSGDTDLLINKKIKSSLKNNLHILFCIGENIKAKKAKKTKRILMRYFQNVKIIFYGKIVIWRKNQLPICLVEFQKPSKR